MRKTYLAIALLLALVPGERRPDPRTLLLRPVDVPGALPARLPSPYAPVRLHPCGPGTAVDLPGAFGATQALRSGRNNVSQVVLEFPSEDEAREVTRRHLRDVGRCDRFSVTVRLAAGPATVETARRPRQARAYGDDSAVHDLLADIPTRGPQHHVEVIVRVDRVLVLLTIEERLVPDDVSLDRIVTAAIERAGG